MISRSNPIVFRPKSNLIGVGVFLFFLIGMNVSSWYTSSTLTSIAVGLLSVGTFLFAILLYVKPKVIFFDEGLTIINPTESYTVGWGEVEGIDTKYTMRIQTRERTISAWAAPGPSRGQARRTYRNGVKESDIQGLGIEDNFPVRPGDLAQTDSGAAAAQARINYLEFQRSTNPTKIDSAHSKSWTGVIIAAIFTVIGASLIALH
jgi:hypothetical protein